LRARIPNEWQLEAGEAGEAVEIGAEDVALECEVGEFASPFDADETGGLKFLHVVGEGGGGNGLGFAEAGTGRGALAASDLGKDFITARRSERTGDEGELTIGDSGLLRGEPGFLGGARALRCHRFYLTPEGRLLAEKLTLDWLTYITLLLSVTIC
jgi:hypothetical protein